MEWGGVGREGVGMDRCGLKWSGVGCDGMGMGGEGVGQALVCSVTGGEATGVDALESRRPDSPTALDNSSGPDNEPASTSPRRGGEAALCLRSLRSEEWTWKELGGIGGWQA